MAQLQKGTTYITGDQVTAANLNALVDSGILTPGAVTDQTAKTVPLAADTILLHSAADTALRKTTMTQLFATPQPLGATTASSVAATTGTFSGTLGVTGVATLGNGAILGTPASGTVSNLTGTASININGTVGATTASTGAFSTLSATGITSLTGAARITGSVGGLGGGAGLELGYSSSSGSINSYDRTNNVYYPLTVTGSTISFAPSGSGVLLVSAGAAAVTGTLSCTGALSKGSGSFRIEHPLPSKSATHQLVHSFIEGPKCDLIYRGKVDLVDGKASVNIDADSTMTEGTFEALCATVQCFTSNESGWGAIRGKVIGNILTIEAQDAASTDNVSWMVIGERKDKHIMDTDWTDENGRPIVEPLKPAEPALESK